MPNIAVIAKERVQAAHLHNSEAFRPLEHFVWTQRPTGPKGGSLSRRTICGTRQSARQMMSRRDDKFRTTCRSTPTRSRTGEQWDTLAAELRERVAQQWQIVHASCGGHSTIKSTEHPECGLALQLTDVYRVNDGA